MHSFVKLSRHPAFAGMMVWLLYGSLSLATIVSIDDMLTMAHQSDAIVRGTVVEKGVKESLDGDIITLVTLKVKEQIKGESTSKYITIYQVGGEFNGRVAKIAGAHYYVINEDIVLFGLYLEDMIVSYGVGLGKFRVMRTNDGEEIVEDLRDIVTIKPGSLVPRKFSSIDELKTIIVDALMTPIDAHNINTIKADPVRISDDSHPKDFKFVCNGITAENTVEEDECGECSGQTAARWIPSTIPLRLDTSIIPKGLSKSDWVTIAHASIDAWNNVPGAKLKMEIVGDVTGRAFGSNPAQHEIFWITDKEEWRRKIGAGEKGILGVTLPQYHCSNDITFSRAFYDADMALNGASNFDWQITCKDQSRDCVSIGATLVHELGHLVGLGHPCATCGWSIMSAQDGNTFEYPVLNDREGLKALYPAGGIPGQLGEACVKDLDCVTGLTCIQQNDVKYCSRNGVTDTCPKGLILGNRDYCVYEHNFEVGLFESCDRRVCQSGLTCAGENNEKYCFADCTSTQPCDNQLHCLPMADETDKGICVSLASLNEACGEMVYCDGNLICHKVDGKLGACRKPCHLKKPGACPKNQRCVPHSNDTGVCLK